jgi:hypothetical protein
VSIRALQAVWRQSRAEGHARLVLLALADVATADLTGWISYARLRSMTRLSLNEIAVAMRLLTEGGEVGHRDGYLGSVSDGILFELKLEERRGT